MIDTQVHPIDAQKGQFWGYVSPFYRRGVGHGHYYFTPDTEFIFQPLLISGDGTNSVLPVLYEHKADPEYRLGFVTKFLKDDKGLCCAMQFLHSPALDLVKPLIKDGAAYFCGGSLDGQMLCDLAEDDRVLRCLIREVSIGRWPGITPLSYKSDEDYVNAYGAATGFYPPQFDEFKLARPVERKGTSHVS